MDGCGIITQCFLSTIVTSYKLQQNVSISLPQTLLSLQPVAMGWQGVPTALLEFGAEFSEILIAAKTKKKLNDHQYQVKTAVFTKLHFLAPARDFNMAAHK